MGGNYLPLVMKGIADTEDGIKLGSHKPCRNTKHVFGLHTVKKVLIFRNRNKYKKAALFLSLHYFTPVTATQKEIRLREKAGR
jgi:hypothetical protein